MARRKRSIENFNPARSAGSHPGQYIFTADDITEITAGCDFTDAQRERLAERLEAAAAWWRTSWAVEGKPTPAMLAKQYGMIAGRLRDYLAGIEAGQEPATRRLYKVLRAGDPPKVGNLPDAMRRGGFQAMAALEAGDGSAAETHLQDIFDGVAGRDAEAVKRLCRWADSLHKRHAVRPGAPNREPSAALTELAAALATIYADTFTAAPGCSRPMGGGDPGGPFMRFARKCVDRIAGSDAPESDETLLIYLRNFFNPPEA